MRASAAFYPSVSRVSATIVLSFLLCSCGLFDQPQPHVHVRHVAPAKPHYSADEFVSQLTLADLALAGNPSGVTGAVPHLAVLEGYTAQKQKKTITEQVVIISYTASGKKRVQRVLAPFTPPEETAGYPALLEVMNTLDAMHYTLHDVRPATAKVAPMSAMKFKDGDMGKAKIQIDQELQVLLQNPEPLAPLTEVQLQLKLIRFFMDHHLRDPAYLSVEDAKHTLAENAGTNPQMEKDLLQQLQALETQLHTTMPFTFTAF